MNSTLFARLDSFREVIIPPLTASKPWHLLPLWLAVAFAMRALIALGGDFALHPDEIMQYLEPAHRAVFGYGVTYWEYVVGARNWIIPGFVAVILWLLDQVGLGTPSVYVYVVKLAFCLISLLVPWGVYHFTRRAVNETSARAALIMACMWPYLVIFAHKPFTEFVATSLFFAALGLLGRSNGTKMSTILTFGALLGGVAAVRLHYTPTAALLWLAASYVLGTRFGLLSAAAGLVVVIMAGMLDWLTWGFPFQSYFLNIVMNIRFDQAREAQEWYFYLHRLLFVSAGGLLIAIWAVIDQPRRFSLVAALFLITLLVHSLAVHKELRFVFVLHGLWLIPLASFIVTFFKKTIERKLLWRVGSFAGAFFLLVVSGLLNDQWLHKAHSRERESKYLLGQSNLFDIYLELSADPNLRGVAHISDPYFNTPGYYYLHQKVPFYDMNSIGEVAKATPDINQLQNRFSHIVGLERIPQVPGFEQIFTDGEYKISVTPNDKAIETTELVDYSPVFISRPVFDAVSEYWKMDPPPYFPEFVK